MAKKILIVEDEPEIAEALTARLRARGYSPMRAFGADQALLAFDGTRPDLLIVSLTLPDDGGVRVCKQIRDRPLGALVPILFLGTPESPISTITDAITAGADHLFQKPGGIGAMLTQVQTYIGPGEPSAGLDHGDMAGEIQRAMDRPDSSVKRSITSSLPRVPEPESEPPGRPIPAVVGSPESMPPDELAAEWANVLQTGRSVALEQRGIGEVFAAASALELSGRVEVAAAGVLRRVFFVDGAPVYGDSSATSEDLAAFLAAEGRVARGALADARRRAHEVGATPEEILIESGHLTPDSVYTALRGYVLERIMGLFALEAGEAMAVHGGPRSMDPVDLGMHPGRIVLDGIRRKYGRLRLYRVFGTTRVVPRPRPGGPPPGLRLRPDESAVLRCCDGQRSVVEVAQAARVPEVEALAILYGLSTLDLVEPPDGRRLSALPPLDRDGMSLDRAGTPRTADQLPGYAELVATKFAEARTADYFQVLNLSPAATGAEVRAAWEQLRQRFDPHRVDKESVLWAQVAEIAEVLDDAHAMLGDAGLRTRYERALG